MGKRWRLTYLRKRVPYGYVYKIQYPINTRSRNRRKAMKMVKRRLCTSSAIRWYSQRVPKPGRVNLYHVEVSK